MSYDASQEVKAYLPDIHLMGRNADVPSQPRLGHIQTATFSRPPARRHRASSSERDATQRSNIEPIGTTSVTQIVVAAETTGDLEPVKNSVTEEMVRQPCVDAALLTTMVVS